MKDHWKTTETGCGYVEVFTTTRDGRPFGYRLTGAANGPCLLVAGICPNAEAVFERIMQIPTLPWMRGQLVMIALDALGDMLGDLNYLPPLGEIDRTIILPWSGSTDDRDMENRRNYHSVLRACADLGMIAGRGVARFPERKASTEGRRSYPVPVHELTAVS